MPQTNSIAGIRRRIIGYGALVVCATGVIVSAAAIAPMLEHYTRERQEFILHEARGKAAALEQYLSHAKGVARQITSRVLARRLFLDHMRGAIAPAEYRRQMADIFSGAIASSTEGLAGIARLDARGRVTARFGVEIPAALRPVASAGSEIRVRGPVALATNRDAGPYLVLEAPLLDEQSRRIGADLIAFDVKSLWRHIGHNYSQEEANQVVLGLLRDGRTETFFVSPAADGEEEVSPLHVAALKQGLEGRFGVLASGGPWDDAVVIAYTPVAGVPWALVVKTDHSRLYAVLRRNGYVLGGLLLVVILAGSAVLALILRPLTGRIAPRAGELEDQMRRTTRDLEQELNERHKAEQALKESEQRHAEILDQAPDPILTLDTLGRITSANAAALRVSGYERSELVGRHFAALNLLTGVSLAVAMREFARIIVGIEIEPVVLWINRKDGRLVALEANPRLVRRWEATEVLVVMRDVTERRSMEQALRESEERLRNLLEVTSDWVWEVDERGAYTYVSPKVRELLGYEPAEVLGKTPFDLMTPEETARAADGVRERVARRESFAFQEYTTRHKDGRSVVLETSGTPVFDAEGRFRGYHGISRDITERKAAQARIQYLAHYDALTELPNRGLFRDRLAQALLHAQRSERLVALLFVDLDRFKIINDTYGHAFGDSLLRETAARIGACVRRSDTVARLGGDEFSVVLTGLHDADNAAKVVQNLVERLAEPYLLDGKEIFAPASIGVTLYPVDEENPERMLHNADTAMYRAKELGGNNYQFYTAEMNVRTRESLALETDLRRALERGEFGLHYQPQVDLATGRIVGHEALLRWRHPGRGAVSPAEFIPILEDNGLIVPVGAWVLQAACAQNRALVDAGHPPLRLSVNLSARQFRQKGLAQTVERVLRDTGHDPALLDLEITESVLMHDVDEAIAELRRLKDLGVQISIDDFGTGYSSLGYLNRFPIDRLKIDRSFVHEVDRSQENAAIVRTIIALARNLGLKTLAEGVETQAELDFLRDLVCDEIQGFYFSRPLPVEEYAALLGGQSATVAPPIGLAAG